MTRAEIWAGFNRSALEHLDDTAQDCSATWHYSERAASAAKLADYMLEEFDRRFPKHKPAQGKP